MSAEPWIAPDHPELIWFRGGDSVRFLNDLISQEVASMAVGSVRRSMLLQPQGKLDQILWVIRGDDEVGLVTEEGRGDDLTAALGRYRIRVEVEIDKDERPTWVIVGSSEFDVGTWRPFNGGLAADVSWAGVERTLIVGNKPTVALGDPDEYELLRIRAGEPRWQVDVDEKTIPQEADLVDSGVDFTKGCYLGQELVARIDSRGHVNRRLRILELDASAEPGSIVVHRDSDVGTMSSVSDRFGLATIRREVEVGDKVTVDGVGATVLDIPPKPQT